MNRRYIDFVPTKDGKKQVEKPAVKVQREVKPKPVAKPVVKMPTATKPTITRQAKPKVTSKVVYASMPALKEKKSVPKVGYSTKVANYKPEPVLGMVEDVNPAILDANTAKRPLGQGRPVSSSVASVNEEVNTAKAQKVGRRMFGRKAEKKPKTVEKPVENSSATQTMGTYQPPKTPFINQSTVTKRPLSKNVYQKNPPVVAKEEPKGPVTIITKPEKEAHVSIVVTIILTIILGAAAGTIAFLLLPK